MTYSTGGLLKFAFAQHMVRELSAADQELNTQSCYFRFQSVDEEVDYILMEIRHFFARKVPIPSLGGMNITQAGKDLVSSSANDVIKKMDVIRDNFKIYPNGELMPLALYETLFYNKPAEERIKNKVLKDEAMP